MANKGSMALLEALYSTELVNFLMYDNPFVSSSSPAEATTHFAASHDSSDATLILENSLKHQQLEEEVVVEEEVKKEVLETPMFGTRRRTSDKVVTGNALGPLQGTRKKRKRRLRACKNIEEAENQRLTHIAVERNRRRQMNEHLAVLRSLMPESYARRSDQASVVGGAVEFVKDLEHLLQNLEAHKLQSLQRGGNPKSPNQNMDDDDDDEDQEQAPFSQFFMYPQITRSRPPYDKFESLLSGMEAIADIEVTLIETHANMRILSRRNPRHLSRLVSGFNALHLTILHLSVTTSEPLVLYSISSKLEEGCQLKSVDGIAGAVHHMLRIIDDEGKASEENSTPVHLLTCQKDHVTLPILLNLP